VRRSPAVISLEPWRYPERPRVLIEHRDADRGLRLATALRNAGCTVAICRGPDALADPTTRCPLHLHERCVAVEGADLVVTVLDFDEEANRAVLRGLRARYPDSPLVVVATVGQALDLRESLERCTVVPIDATPDRIAAAVLDTLPAKAQP
jgi:hypothetical protein